MPQLLYNTRRTRLPSLHLDDLVLDAAVGGRLEEYLFVVPHSRRRRDLERRITDAYWNATHRPIGRLPLQTLDSFTRALFARLSPERRELSPEMQIALMDRAMRNVELDYYAPNRNPSAGLVESISRVINGVRADGILPSDFARDAEFARSDPNGAEGFDAAKLTDLANIYAEYLRLLDGRWIDHPGRLLLVNAGLVDDRDTLFARTFPSVRVVYIDGFSEFTGPEIALLQQLGFVSDLSVLITLDYEADNGPLYGNFDDAIATLRSSGYRQTDLDPLQRGIPEERRRPFRHHMRRNLFRTDERIRNHAFDRMVNVYGFFNREEEVRGIAALVKWLIAEEHFAPERICITTRQMAPYVSLMREELASHGIPANVTTRYRLDQNALVTALFSALMIVVGGYDHRDVLRAVTSPYLDFGDAVDPAALTDAARRLRITRGERLWRRRIDGRIEYVRARLESAGDDDVRASLETELETLEHASDSFEALREIVSELDRAMTPGEFRSAFLRLTARLDATGNILRLRHDLERRHRSPQDWQRVHDEVERDTRALGEFSSVLDDLMQFIEIHYESEAGDDAVNHADGQRRYRLGFYLEHLRIACSRSVYALREKHDYGVLVTPIGEMRGIDFDVVILCGLVDGEFPGTYIPESFLGRPLPDAQDRELRRERIDFYSAITACRDRLVMTWPRFRDDTRLVRSSFLDAFLRITMVEDDERVIELDELRVMRERIRRVVVRDDHLRFVSSIATLDTLAEEAGRALWTSQRVPRIDTAESMLENLRHTSDVERARARSVNEEDESLARAWRGLIEESLSDDQRQELARRREEEYSASQLELYGRCPFKYFAGRVLGARAASEYDVTLTPLERGQLLHTVLFRLYSELRDASALPITPERRDEALDRARAIAREEIEGIVFDHPYWRIDQERMLGGDYFGGLLEHWIDAEVDRGEGRTKLAPAFFEASFGRTTTRGECDPYLSSTDQVEFHGVRVRGRIDRVEYLRVGDTVYYAVADYKTGKPPTRGDVGDGLSLQLMIYLEVVRHALATYFALPLEQVRPVGGIYYRLQTRDMESSDTYLFVPREVNDQEIIRQRKVAGDPETIEELEALVARSFEFARSYVDGIAEGRFDVTHHDTAHVCKGCEYASVCRVGELRPG